MVLEKYIAYGMRGLSICIAVVIFLLSAQSKMPVPLEVWLLRFPIGFQPIHGFRNRLSVLSWLAVWLPVTVSPMKYTKSLFPGGMRLCTTGLPTVPEQL